MNLADRPLLCFVSGSATAERKTLRSEQSLEAMRALTWRKLRTEPRRRAPTCRAASTTATRREPPALPRAASPHGTPASRPPHSSSAVVEAATALVEEWARAPVVTRARGQRRSLTGNLHHSLQSRAHTTRSLRQPRAPAPAPAQLARCRSAPAQLPLNHG
jgi:hypothetical protein